MKRYAFLILSAAILTGCTDIRTRLSPDILAADTGAVTHFAAHTSQDEPVITAEAPDCLLMPDALRGAAGAEISTGHLSLLAVSGNPCGITEQYLQAQYLAPTCAVLSVPQDACAMLKDGILPTPDEIKAAVDTGMLPSRTADTAVGDLWSGTGITAFCAYENGALTLALWDADGKHGTLSPDACRGLALFGQQYETFAFEAGGAVFRLQKCAPALHLRMDDRLHITVSGQFSAAPPLTDTAGDRLREMLAAAMQETVCDAGADLLFLHEAALRDHIPDASHLTQEKRRAVLQNADYQICIKCA